MYKEKQIFSDLGTKQSVQRETNSQWLGDQAKCIKWNKQTVTYGSSEVYKEKQTASDLGTEQRVQSETNRQWLPPWPWPAWRHSFPGAGRQWCACPDAADPGWPPPGPPCCKPPTTNHNIHYMPQLFSQSRGLFSASNMQFDTILHGIHWWVIKCWSWTFNAQERTFP